MQRDPDGNREVERIDRRRDRNADAVIRRGQRSGRQPVAFGPGEPRQILRTWTVEEGVDRDRRVLRRERGDADAARALLEREKGFLRAIIG